MSKTDRNLKRIFQALPPRELPLETLSACAEQKGAFPMKKTNLVFRRAVAAAAAFFLVVGAVGGVVLTQRHNAPVSTVSLDVNPSIELKLSRREKVLEAIPRNQEARDVLGTMNLKNSDLEVAVNALIGSMVRKGYLTENANSVLISVSHRNNAEASRLRQKLETEIETLLHTDTFDGAVLSQTVHPNNDLKQQAETADISIGKAQLIKTILTQNPQRTFEELSRLTINELKLLVESLQPKEVTSTGSASQKGYIGAEKAREIALKHAGVSIAPRIETDLDWEQGTMCYELEFVADGIEYEYEINAKTGAVLKHQKKEPLSDNDQTITADQALNIALDHAGVPAAEARGTETERDREDGSFEVEFRHKGLEYSYEIDARTGAVLSHEKEWD